jgi:mono/diheme cytochrome c family protein
MQTKWVVPVLIMIAVIVAIFIIIPREPKVVSEPRMPKGWAFTLPKGDAKAGEETFMRMQCYSCHAIDLASDSLPPDMGGIGPKLVAGYAQLPNEYLAESIIKAHDQVAAPDYKIKAGVAGMGNYNDYLTVKELTDLVAFLKARSEVAVK